MTAPLPDRVLTQNALTGQWTSTALPLTELEYGDELSGPGSLTGKLTPRLVSSSPSLVDPGNTYIYVESAGQLVWGGIIWDVRSTGSEYAVEAASWSSYLQHRYDLNGEFGGRGPYTYGDRCQVVRDIWAYAQSVADGNLGVVVDATTSTSTIGTPDDVYHSYSYDVNCLGDKIDGNLRGLLLDVRTWAREGLMDAAIPAGYYRDGGNAEKAGQALKDETEGKIPVWTFGWVPTTVPQFDADYQTTRKLGFPQLLLWEGDYIDDRPNKAELQQAMRAKAK